MIFVDGGAGGGSRTGRASGVRRFDGGRVRGEEFTGDDEAWFIDGTEFDKCRFDRLRVKGPNFGAGPRQAVFSDCVFERVRMGFAAGDMRFERCLFTDVRVVGWIAHQCELVDCVVTGTLKNVQFFGQIPEQPEVVTQRTTNDFAGNDFSGADLRDVSFMRGIDLGRQKLPTGDGLVHIRDAEGWLAQVDEVIPTLAGEEQDEARAWSWIFRRSFDLGERGFFIRIDDFTRIESRESLRELLRLTGQCE